jgi:hypothetical protein
VIEPPVPVAEPPGDARDAGAGPIPSWQRWTSRAELRAGAAIVLALALIGVLLGLVWFWWSPPGPVGVVIAPHAVQPLESETFAATDGRFAVLTGVVGLLAGVLLWFARPVRGPVAALALAAGGVVGALLTDGVGRLLDNGRGDGPVDTVLRHLPLRVHMPGLWVLEALLALLGYGICVAFAHDDDLGRVDPGRSVRMGDEAQHGWRDGDRPGALDQPDLAPQ